MKNLIKIILFFIMCPIVQAQTIEKIASNNNPHLGEEFYYTITIKNLNNLNDLNYIEDILGNEVDYVGVEYNSSFQLLQNWFCGSVIANYDITLKKFKLIFTNCNGQPIGINSFSFKLKVKLNDKVCDKGFYQNTADLYLKSGKFVSSDISKVTLNTADPFTLQKTFRNYTAGVLTYDVRLNTAFGNFKTIDFNSNPKFSDEFKIPSCLNLGANPTNSIEVVAIPDTNLMTPFPIPYTTSLNNSNLRIEWNLDASSNNNTSILYQVKIKIDDCTCVNQLFKLENQAYFDGKNKCGNNIKKQATSNIENVACTNRETDIPIPLKDSICVTKTLKLDGNDLNLVMKGCTGKYTIDLTNCTDRLVYKNVKLTDLIPAELDITGPIVITGNATSSLTGNNLTVQSTNYLSPNESIQIIIPFEVTTPDPNKIIKNCATVDVYGYDNIRNAAFTLNRTVCATPLVTVPNKVALHTSKEICNKPNHNCGPFSVNNNLPGDTVEYALHFYNYGTAEGIDIKVEDQLPAYFKIQNVNTDVKVYAKYSGRVENDICQVPSFSDITTKVKVGYNTTSNKLVVGLLNNKLNEFTCNGVMHYVVKFKAKIDTNTPNGTYNNQFVVRYYDTSTKTNESEISEQVSSHVNVDNLIIGFKTVEATGTDCDKKTQTATYKIVLANFGDIPVFADISDGLVVPNPVNVISIGNFRKCTISGASSGLCSPTTVFSPTTINGNNFTINRLPLNKCEVVVIEYDVVFNTNLLSGNQEVTVCNNADVNIYTPGMRTRKAVLTSNPALIQNYMLAKTDVEKVEAIELIKATKHNPEIFKNQSISRFSNLGNIPISYDFGTERISDGCSLKLKDCLNGRGNGCFSDKSTSFEFSITGMNANGDITTSLINNSGKKISKIEYLLTDVRQIQSCEDSFYYFKGRQYGTNCHNCSLNISGNFYTTNTAPINGMLNMQTQPNLNGTYFENNKVTFSGTPTTLTQDNRTFKFPMNLNCKGTFEFTITAIVHFDDCTVCYVTDAYDFNASFRFIYNQNQGKPIFRQ